MTQFKRRSPEDQERLEQAVTQARGVVGFHRTEVRRAELKLAEQKSLLAQAETLFRKLQAEADAEAAPLLPELEEVA